jgi:hypothetical protein
MINKVKLSIEPSTRPLWLPEVHKDKEVHLKPLNGTLPLPVGRKLAGITCMQNQLWCLLYIGGS